MRLFRHSKAIVLVLSVCLLMGLVPGNRFTAAARAAEPIVPVEKTIASFGTSALTPRPADGTDYWRGDYVYFGTYDNKPIRFRVLSPSTTDFGGTTVLLESERVLDIRKAFDNNTNDWASSFLKTYLNDDFFSSNFKPGEQ